MQVVIKNLDAHAAHEILAVLYNVPVPYVGELIDISYNDRGKLGCLTEVVKVVHQVRIFIGSLDGSHESITVWVKEKDRKGRTDNI